MLRYYKIRDKRKLNFRNNIRDILFAKKNVLIDISKVSKQYLESITKIFYQDIFRKIFRLG